MSEDFRKEAELHWKFIEPLLVDNEVEETEVPLEKVKYLYVEAMVHGFKHHKQLTERESQSKVK
jgi:hypothetical protein